MEEILIIGYGGHAESIIDTVMAIGNYNIVGYTDKKQNKNSKLSYLGTDDVLEKYFAIGIKNAILGIGFMGKEDMLRKNLYNQAKRIGYYFPTIIDPSAIVASSAQVGEGTFIGKKAVVNANAKIGKYCIINTGAIIEHEGNIEDGSHIAVGTILCGKVSIGQHCFLGAGTTVIQNISIGEHAIIGANAVVVKNIPKWTTSVGIPAKVIKERNSNHF